ncbi:MAG: DNA polymerase III subunit gamma/tau [Oscillospiraceae bacterium]|jgi:DNA polymerase-3 subunit gamma/tau|nr:DNA polymerase III subunit gamma/tau [Oscillospiraceae bacterium]
MPDSPPLALYRQWRSKRFDEQVGQDAISAALKAQARDGSITHAYLFSGPRGTGKTSTARIFARAINCLQPEDGEPCGHCAACVFLENNDGIDVIEMDAASNNRVDDMRVLTERVVYAPSFVKRRVYIVDEAHMITPQAFNAFLKTLEEPPPHVVFILATTEPRKLPETILSRCQWYAFHRIEPRLIVGRLELVARTRGIPITEGALWLIARAADGGMRDALSLLDVCRATNTGTVTEERVRAMLGAADPQTLFTLAQACAAKDTAAALRLVNAAYLSGLDPQELASNMAGHVRSLLIAQTAGGDLPRMLAVTEDEAGRYREQSSRFRMDNLLRLLDLFAQAAQTNRWNADPRLALEAAALRACVPEDTLRLEEMAARVDALERALANLHNNAPIPTIQPTAAQTTAAPPAIAAPKPRQAETTPETIEPAAAPAAEPAAPAATDPRKLWTKALDILTRSKPGLMAQLRHGAFTGVEDGAARVAFPADKSFQADYIRNNPANIAAIEDAIGQAFGSPLRLSVDAASGTPAPKPQPDVQQQVFDMFSREKVEVVENDAPF